MAATAPPRRRIGGRSARVRAAVLDATVELLLAKGVDALSVAEIAECAGVHETSIYRRWGTKANLGLEAVLSRAELEVPIPDTGSLGGDLLALARAIVNFQRSPLGRALFLIGLRSDLPEYDAARDAFWAARLSLAGTVLERAEARGELRAGVDHRTVLEALTGLFSLRVFMTHEPLDDGFLRTAVDLILTGITPTSTAVSG